MHTVRNNRHVTNVGWLVHELTDLFIIPSVLLFFIFEVRSDGLGVANIAYLFDSEAVKDFVSKFVLIPKRRSDHGNGAH
jgi:hypothetical protein